MQLRDYTDSYSKTVQCGGEKNGYLVDEFYVTKIVKRLLDVTRKPEVLCKALELLKDRNCKSRFDIGEHLINTTQDVSLLLSLCEGGKNANLIAEGAFKKEIFLKLAGMPEKLPDTAVLDVLDATDSVYAPIVKDAALRKRLIARLPEKDAVKFALEEAKYFSWGNDQRLDEIVAAASVIRNQELTGTAMLGIFKAIAECERSRRESGKWGKEDIAKVEALRKRLPKLGDTAIEKMLCTDEAVWPYLINDVSADVAYNLLSGKKVKSATLESELLKKLPKDRLQVIVEAKEKAFAALCEKAKAAEKETFALDGFYPGCLLTT